SAAKSTLHHQGQWNRASKPKPIPARMSRDLRALLRGDTSMSLDSMSANRLLTSLINLGSDKDPDNLDKHFLVLPITVFLSRVWYSTERKTGGSKPLLFECVHHVSVPV